MSVDSILDQYSKSTLPVQSTLLNQFWMADYKMLMLLFLLESSFFLAFQHRVKQLKIIKLIKPKICITHIVIVLKYLLSWAPHSSWSTKVSCHFPTFLSSEKLPTRMKQQVVNQPSVITGLWNEKWRIFQDLLYEYGRAQVAIESITFFLLPHFLLILSLFFVSLSSILCFSLCQLDWLRLVD